MIFSCLALHRSLQKELSSLPARTALQPTEVEQYFKFSLHHWMDVYKLLTDYTFGSVQEEICFFRRVKPLFTSELEYAQLLCNALLFLPEQEQQDYWQREGERLASFVREHRAFCRYYRLGPSRCDAHYFTRVNDLDRSLPLRHYPDEGLVSLYDPLVGRLLALKRYNGYVQLQLRNRL